MAPKNNRTLSKTSQRRRVQRSKKPPKNKYALYPHHRSTMACVEEKLKELKNENKITKEHLDEFDKTPFNAILRAIYDEKFEKTAMKSNQEITRIASCFNKETDLFDFTDNISLGITKRDVALIFGFPLEPKEKDEEKEKGKKQYVKDVCLKYFRGKQGVNYKLIFEKMDEVLAQPQTMEMVRDFTVLTISSLCAAFFFPNVSGALNKGIIEDVEHRMHSIDWPQLIVDKLINTLRKKDETKKGLAGCALLLLYWFVERVDVHDLDEKRKNIIPRAARWKLPEITTAIAITTFSDLQEDQVHQEMLDISEDEKHMLEQKTKLIQLYEDELRIAEENLKILKDKKVKLQGNLALINKKEKEIENVYLDLKNKAKKIKRLQNPNEKKNQQKNSEEERNEEQSRESIRKLQQQYIVEKDEEGDDWLTKAVKTAKATDKQVVGRTHEKEAQTAGTRHAREDAEEAGTGDATQVAMEIEQATTSAAQALMSLYSVNEYTVIE